MPASSPLMTSDPLASPAVFRGLVVGTIVYIGVISVFFLAFPGVDQAATRAFHDAQGGFWAASDPFFMRLRELGPFLVKFVAAASLVVLILAAVVPRLPDWVSLRAPLFLLSSLALGPGVLVNAVFKNNWGRPRPNAVDLFGGDAPYVEVWRISDYCERNCSFVSGEASSSLWLVTLALLAPPRWRAGILCVVLPLCLALSANRVAFGGHFLSDTLLSWGVTFLVILGLYQLFYRTPPAVLREARLRHAFACLAVSLRRLWTQTMKRIRSLGRRFIAMMR
ncbi:phosphatase PAP2 family protein [Stappia sp. ES.058]|uniref:phosphatase PAP2 family protein n=1 Tax=Stappia sp. ES.058 TaxID=1881061 RepID=UPI00087A102F|nr:phosphatase PAP2 family protein [Stappia sp. ES.058]SDU39801.1 Membrane-associated enzyme, PAP2 (acid phosphatase) superfamily [Stappia sp. ES.058]